MTRVLLPGPLSTVVVNLQYWKETLKCKFLQFSILLFILCVHACVPWCMRGDRGQLSGGFSSLIWPCGSWGSDSAVSALTCCTTLSTLFLFSSLSLFSGQQSLRESFEIRFAKSLLSNLSLAFSSCSQHGSDNVRLKANIQAHLMKISEKGE